MRVFKKFDLLVQIPFLLMLVEKMFRVFVLDDRQIFWGLWTPLVILVVWKFASQLLHAWWGFTRQFKFHFYRQIMGVLSLSWLICTVLFVLFSRNYLLVQFLFFFACANILLHIALLIAEIRQLDNFLSQSSER